MTAALTRPRRSELRSGHLVVGAWTAGNGVLAGLMLGFRAQPISMLLWLFDLVLLSGFGLAVVVALRSGRGVGTSVRMPVRSTAAVFTALGLTVAGLSLAYGWMWLLVALYPLATAAVLVRGERVAAGVRPEPAALDGMPPAPGVHRQVHDGTATGAAVAVPGTHPVRELVPADPTSPQEPARPVVAAVATAAVVRGLLRAFRRRT
ncbi:MAG: hypothetical protein J0I34_18925 [Pseudonocardia sp.]|uniref:hypothetical protein n=1 Tax=unclassified Pseudonocardia TaxID=2619320 RepID=UPI00086D2503|nr:MULTISPECIES: hypothetical protein [unclassified Pseudonocardia]MBN9110841.1 hypothetical protein [Pseudonocardia sp.]ODU26857.1 MAG: hypothetical protein ABS80_05765 [Pseudonocardia sp. SCN 72-51]ODV05422.1 MAG: hypothetical protein ABT15_17210 [Pseudonocardia sp. SCN 73-27]